MSDQYRLVFSGEVLEGQHAAVVKKRLAAILKLDDGKMDVLFSGKAVVVKNATDEKNAARYQEAFQKAGARLRVLPVEDDAASEPAPSSSAPSKAPSPGTQSSDAGEQTNDAASAQESNTPDADATSSGLALTPAGTAVLTEDERPEVETVEVETDHLKVQSAVFITDEPEESVPVPNVDHLTLAELGAQLGHTQAQEAVLQEIDVEFDLAEVGAVLGSLDESREMPPLPAPDFELAEPGAELDTREKAPPPSAPDTSHLKVNEDDDETT